MRPCWLTLTPKRSLPEPPADVTHVYARQHKALGLEAPYNGPFKIVSRPSRSTVVIQVGLTATGEPRHETRSWRDLKVAHVAPDTKEAHRPRRGRPKKNTSSLSEADSTTENKQPVAPAVTAEESATTDRLSTNNLNVGGKPVRSTRNPNPSYVDEISTSLPWSPIPFQASESDIKELNRRIGGH